MVPSLRHDIEEILERLSLPTFEERRDRDLIVVFGSIEEMEIINKDDLLMGYYSNILEIMERKEEDKVPER